MQKQCITFLTRTEQATGKLIHRELQCNRTIEISEARISKDHARFKSASTLKVIESYDEYATVQTNNTVQL